MMMVIVWYSYCVDDDDDPGDYGDGIVMIGIVIQTSDGKLMITVRYDDDDVMMVMSALTVAL